MCTLLNNLKYKTGLVRVMILASGRIYIRERRVGVLLGRGFGKFPSFVVCTSSPFRRTECERKRRYYTLYTYIRSGTTSMASRTLANRFAKKYTSIYSHTRTFYPPRIWCIFETKVVWQRKLTMRVSRWRKIKK